MYSTRYHLSMLCLVLLCLCSCRSYYMTATDFNRQFSGLQAVKDTIRYFWGQKATAYLMPIRHIECADRKGRPVTLTNKASHALRVTAKSGRKDHFFLNQVLVTHDSLYGISQTLRLPAWQSVAIPVKSIRCIKITKNMQNVYW